MSTTPPGGSTTPPGGACVPCTTGTLEVRVYLQTVCWDTDPALGEDTPDRPFKGVEVWISGPTARDPKPTDGSGVATFDALKPGTYSVSVLNGFDDVSGEVPDPL